MSQETLEKIKADIASHKILIYIKGTRTSPLCGFSAATVKLMDSFGVPYETRDVIANPDFRQLVPALSNWPTFPQVFVGGELIGGCDIVHEMNERGELGPLLKKAVG